MSWLGNILRDIWAPEDLPQRLPQQYDIAAKPQPKLVAVTRAPSRDDFAIWRDDPATRFVFAALRVIAAEQREAWLQTSWHGGMADPALLTELRTRADAYESMEAGDYEAFCNWAGVEPEPLAGDSNAA